MVTLIFLNVDVAGGWLGYVPRWKTIHSPGGRSLALGGHPDLQFLTFPDHHGSERADNSRGR